MTRPKPVFHEIAPRRSDSFWNQYFDPEDLPAHILRSEGCHGGGIAGLFRLYDEMEEKDGHLFAVLQTRKNGVLACPRRIVAASDSPRDQEIARFVDKVLNRIRDFDQSLLQLLDALGKGLSVLEILWEVRDGHVWAKELRSRAPRRFSFSSDGALQLSPDFLPASSPANAARPLPDRKFLRFTFGGLYGNPYGRGLCARAYWYCWFKKNNLKFWVMFNEKFGAPTVVGRYRPGATDEERGQLLQIIDSLQNDSGVTIPESVTLELLEARRSGNVSTYRELADWCNDEISKIVLGATLTSGEGRRSGSQALGQVHERVRDEYVESDARALENALNAQLIRWIVDFNFGPDADAPRLSIDTSRDDGLEADLALDRGLVALGVALPKPYFYDKYKRPAPLPGQDALCFDDQNLFQYHLQFGIVTVNEARQRLGMPPVPWGGERVRTLTQDKSGLTHQPAFENKPGQTEPDPGAGGDGADK